MGHRRKASSVKVSETRMKRQVELQPLTEPCPKCGKFRYLTRKGARAARKRTNHSDSMSVYMCGEYWHIGHTPWQIKQSLQARSNTRGEFKPDWTLKRPDREST